MRLIHGNAHCKQWWTPYLNQGYICQTLQLISFAWREGVLKTRRTSSTLTLDDILRRHICLFVRHFPENYHDTVDNKSKTSNADEWNGVSILVYENTHHHTTWNEKDKNKNIFFVSRCSELFSHFNRIVTY